jgi:hypothetical protein
MAGVFPLDIVAPGAFGVNTEKQNVLLRPQWATKALNGVVNRAGRLAARKGWQNQTTNAIASTPQIAVMHEYLNEAGASVIISTATTKIYKDIDDFTDAANDITSTTAPTNLLTARCLASNEARYRSRGLPVTLQTLVTLVLGLTVIALSLPLVEYGLRTRTYRLSAIALCSMILITLLRAVAAL